MTWIRSNALGAVAIVIALSSGAYAVTTAPKNSVVSKSIKNAAVKGKDLADNAITSAKVKDNALTGADIDESTLSLPSSGDKVDHLVLRLPPNSPTSVRATYNGLDLLLGCTGSAGAVEVGVSHQTGLSLHSAPSTGFVFAVRQGAVSNQILVPGLDPNFTGIERIDFRRASDGATVRVDYSWNNYNSAAPGPGPLDNDDCVYTVEIFYSA